VFRLNASCEEIPSKFFRYSTHAFSLAEAVEMARALDTLPSELILFGIEGLDFGAGTGFSAPVAASAMRVVEAVVDELQSTE
jgi:hydrogenase maturation protease